MLSIGFVNFQAQFSQVRPVAMVPTAGTRFPMYPPGAPGVGQHIFYGQAPPGLIPPQVTIILLLCTLIYLFFQSTVLTKKFNAFLPCTTP